MVSASLSDASNSITSSAAEVSVVAFRVNNPIVPADCSEVNVERVTAALTRAWSTVHASRLPAYRPLRKRVNHNEWLSVVVH